jgi:hypothetical protein
MRTYTSPGRCYGPSLRLPLRARVICRFQSSADPNRFAIDGLALMTSSAYGDTAGGAMRAPATRSVGAKRTGKLGAVAEAQDDAERVGRDYGKDSSRRREK